MHIGDLSADEPADQDLGRVADGSCQPEDLLPFGMAPPAAAYPSADDCLSQVRDRPSRAFEDNAMAFDERERRTTVHRR
jgi:hypothetical protein